MHSIKIRGHLQALPYIFICFLLNLYIVLCTGGNSPFLWVPEISPLLTYLLLTATDHNDYNRSSCRVGLISNWFKSLGIIISRKVSEVNRM
jgi:hypothetical protein